MAARGADGRFVAGVDLTLEDHVSGPMKRILQLFPGLEKAGKRTAKAFEFAANAKQAADGMKGFRDGMVGAVSAPIKKMVEFEDIMARVRANTFNGVQTAQTQAEFKQLGETARKLGADTKFSGVEAAEGLDILATAGFDAQGQMAALPGILDLAAASNQSIAEAAEISTSAMSQFGLKATDLGRIGDVIAKTAQSSKTGLLDLGEAMKYAGVSANNAGVSIEETTAMLGALGDAGVKGSAAGTALRSIFSSLQAPNKKGQSALDFLGINTKDKSGNMRPINDILKEMDAAMDKKFGKDKNGNRRATLLKGLFDEANAASASLIIAKAGTGALEAKINENLGASGTAAKVAADMGNSTAGSARELSSAMEELQLSVGELLVPAVRDFVDSMKGAVEWVTSWAKENPEWAKTLATVAGALTVLTVGIWAGTTAAGAASTAFGVLTTVFNVLKIAMLTNPILAIMAAVAVAAVLIYQNWEPLKKFFQTHWKAIAIVFAPVMIALAPIIGAAKLISDNWEPLKKFFVDLWDSITSGFQAAMNWILDKIKWVGEKVEAFSIAVMSPEEAAAYAANKAAQVLSDAKANGTLFDDDLDTSLTGRKGGQAAFDAEQERRNAQYAFGEAKNGLNSFLGGGQAGAGPADQNVAQGPALMAADPTGPTSTITKGDLRITIDSEGKVTKTQLKTGGDSPFSVRVNTGAQA